MILFNQLEKRREAEREAMLDKLVQQVEAAGFTNKREGIFSKNDRAPLFRIVDAGVGLKLEVWINVDFNSRFTASIWLNQSGDSSSLNSLKLVWTQVQVTQKEADDPTWFQKFMREQYREVTDKLSAVAQISAAGAFTGLI